MDNEPLFRPEDVIYAYTRAQAIEDGVLVDVTPTAREAGFRYPVALTSAVWLGVVEPDDKAKRHGESVAGRLWDVLWMAYHAIRAAKNRDLDTVPFRLLATRGGIRETVDLKAVCGPGDRGEPVITIMEPSED